MSTASEGFEAGRTQRSNLGKRPLIVDGLR
jgi:hypothetical protein